MKVREFIRLLEADGWFLVATRGSNDLAPGTLNSIRKQAGPTEKH